MRNLFIALLFVIPFSLHAQESDLLSKLSIKPLRGQTTEQKNKDSLQCAEVAKEQVEKMKNEEQSNGSKNNKSSLGRGAARGAAIGSVRGEIIDGEPGRGAAVGAIGGGIRAGIRRRMMEKKEKEAKQKAGKQALGLSFSTCMQERGYQVNF